MIGSKLFFTPIELCEYVNNEKLKVISIVPVHFISPSKLDQYLLFYGMPVTRKEKRVIQIDRAVNSNRHENLNVNQELRK